LIYNIGGLLRDMKHTDSSNIVAQLCELGHYATMEPFRPQATREGVSNDLLGTVVALALLDLNREFEPSFTVESRALAFQRLEVSSHHVGPL